MKTIKNNWKVALIVAAGIVAVILLCVFGVQSSQNRAFALEEQVHTADSDIKVQEKRRVDLVYNLADCVKQYDKHEAETLTAIVEGRGSTGDIENVTTAITAVSEAYPELKSNDNYKELMNELSITENLIAEYRSNYNKQVKEYNRYVRKFPTRIFLNILGYEVQEYTYLDYDAPVDAPQKLFGE
jgi:LemA protein